MKKLTPNLLRVQRFSCTVFFLAMFYCTTGFAQSNNFSKEHIDNCILEVFQNHAEELVFNSSSTRYDLINDFFQRIEIVSSPKTSGEKLTNLSNLKLNNKYNQNLQHDVVTDVQNFNPLKYSFNMNPTVQKRVRLNDNYIILINPKK